jgi:hypothetical protein
MASDFQDRGNNDHQHENFTPPAQALCLLSSAALLEIVHGDIGFPLVLLAGIASAITR